jgi:uncharacterized protein YdeI (YjbR/CyaY-like superfamily)
MSVPRDAQAHFFASPAEFRAWLEANHASSAELWVGFHKRATGRPSLRWSESVDEALCFGWIDGVRKRVDAERYVIRFSPRKPDSIWSAVNLAKMAALLAAGRVAPAGRAAHERRSAAKSGVYSYEQRGQAAFDPELERRFRAAPGAWRFFADQPPGYRRLATYWVVSAKRAETRQSRLEKLIDCCAAGRRLPELARPAAKESPA